MHRRVDSWRPSPFGVSMIRKAIICAALLAFGVSAHAELTWEKTELELRPTAGDATAVGNFKYQNNGDKTVHLASVHTSCGCTTAGVKKNDVAPGEKGEITATFNIGGRTGVQTKTVTVATDDPKQPTTLLTLTAVIAQPLELQPALVFWDLNEAPTAKTVTAKASPESGTKNLEVGSPNPEFQTKVEPGKGPGEFRILVTPRSTAAVTSGTLTVKAVGAAGGPGKTSFVTVRVINTKQGQ